MYPFPKRISTLLSLLAVVLLVFAPHQHAFGQSQTGAIAGTVADPTGALLKGAEISVQSPALTTSTNEEGRFYINDLAPGTYKLTITYVGLSPYTSTVTVSAGQTATLHAAMQAERRQLS